MRGRLRQTEVIQSKRRLLQAASSNLRKGGNEWQALAQSIHN
jgi:hypothetical protein